MQNRHENAFFSPSLALTWAGSSNELNPGGPFPLESPVKAVTSCVLITTANSQVTNILGWGADLKWIYSMLDLTASRRYLLQRNSKSTKHENLQGFFPGQWFRVVLILFGEPVGRDFFQRCSFELSWVEAADFSVVRCRLSCFPCISAISGPNRTLVIYYLLNWCYTSHWQKVFIQLLTN